MRQSGAMKSWTSRAAKAFISSKQRQLSLMTASFTSKNTLPLTVISIHITGKIRADLLRIRWDNAPHHRDICTFPHHKHLPNLEESKEMSLDGVLKEIKEWLQRPK
jgi:hypothetical protein